MATAIQNPFSFYYISKNDWNNSHNYLFWNKNFSTDSDPGITNVTTLKTIYDPCVSSFTIPKTAAFTGFTKSGANSGNVAEFNVSGSYINGWNFYTNGWKTGGTIFFETMGYRNTDHWATTSSSALGAGEIRSVGTESDYWTVGASSSSFARFLYFHPEYVYPQNSYYRSYGINIRSVKE